MTDLQDSFFLGVVRSAGTTEKGARHLANRAAQIDLIRLVRYGQTSLSQPVLRFVCVPRLNRSQGRARKRVTDIGPSLCAFPHQSSI